jgi:hypothetical protein
MPNALPHQVLCDRIANIVYTLQNFKITVKEVSNGTIECITEGAPDSLAQTNNMHKFRCNYKQHIFEAKGVRYSGSKSECRCRICSEEKNYLPPNGQHILAELLGGTCFNKAPLIHTQKQLLVWKCSNDDHPPSVSNFNSNGTSQNGIKVKTDKDINICSQCAGKKQMPFVVKVLITALREDQLNCTNCDPKLTDTELLNLYDCSKYKELPDDAHHQFAAHFGGYCLSKAPLKKLSQRCIWWCGKEEHMPSVGRFDAKCQFLKGELIFSGKLTKSKVSFCVECDRTTRPKITKDKFHKDMLLDYDNAGGDTTNLTYDDLIDEYEIVHPNLT